MSMADRAQWTYRRANDHASHVEDTKSKLKVERSSRKTSFESNAAVTRRIGIRFLRFCLSDRTASVNFLGDFFYFFCFFRSWTAVNLRLVTQKNSLFRTAVKLLLGQDVVEGRKNASPLDSSGRPKFVIR